MPAAEDLAKRLVSVEKKVKRIESKMITRDELHPLVESIELITENPSILKEIDEALREYRRGKYYTYEQVFGGKPKRTS